MTTMVDKIAKALADSVDDGLHWYEYRENAVTALEAMIDPGGYVEEAGWQKSRTMLQEDWLSLDEIGQIFNEMIRAAIKEQE